MHKGILVLGLVALTPFAFTGCVGTGLDHQKGTAHEPSARRHRPRAERPAPPPPEPLAEAIPPAPATNAVWIPGAWVFDDRSYAWSAGHWEIPPPHAQTYVAAHREWQGDRYVIVPGAWR